MEVASKKRKNENRVHDHGKLTKPIEGAWDKEERMPLHHPCSDG